MRGKLDRSVVLILTGSPRLAPGDTELSSAKIGLFWLMIVEQVLGQTNNDAGVLYRKENCQNVVTPRLTGLLLAVPGTWLADWRLLVVPM